MTQLNAQALMAMPYEQMVACIKSWNRHKMEESHSWRFWRRNDQFEPQGDWRTWLVMAGRGYGKTRMGAEWVSALATQYPGARFALVGATQNALGSHNALLIDEKSSLEIELLNGSMLLANRDTQPLASDAPVFHVGGEFFRVGRVIALGAKRYRLSRFARACFSDQLSAPAHAAGSRIVWMDPASTRIMAATDYHIGQTITVEAQGLGDINPVVATAVANGRAITPLAPVHGRARRQANGDIHLNWVRRSRLDLGWVDGVDQLMVEDREAYHVKLLANDNILRDWTVFENALHISADDYAGFGVQSGRELGFSVQQIGRFTQSTPLVFGLA
jgi:hypothetical protein